MNWLLRVYRFPREATAGRVYQIAVDGHNGASGNITLRIHTHAKTPTNVSATDGTLTDRVRVTWRGSVYAAIVVGVEGKDRLLVHYEGHENAWDEVVTIDRIVSRRP